MLAAYLGRISAGDDLTLPEMTAVIDHVMRGEASEGEIGVLLMALRAKGETADEIAGAALAMRRHMTPIRSSRLGILDTCGTGGVGSDVFNISTSAALVAAAAGVPVAKHGNRSITSRSGSADVLAALDVNIGAAVATVERCLEELGICFCFAPQLHPAMKHVSAVRKQLGVATIFNLLGPLCNPASAPYQLLGVGKPELHERLASVLARLEPRRAVVVHGEDGLGEVTLAGPTRVIEVCGRELRSFTWRPEDFGLTTAPRDSLVVANPSESAALIRRVLSGEPGPPRDIVLLNAAAALWTVGKVETPLAGATLAAQAIDSGAAARLLAQLATLSSQP